MDLRARRADSSDAALLWGWANDPETRRRSFNKAPIPYADHLRWLARVLGSPNIALWIFSDGAEPVGHVRIDVAGEVGEVSIVVAPEHRRRGYGTAMLTAALGLARQDFDPGITVRALVLHDNVGSLALFTACGFQVVGVTSREDGQQAAVLELPAVRRPVGGVAGC